MDTIGSVVSAVILSITGYGWAAYFGASVIAVGVALAAEYVRTKGTRK